MMVKSVSRLVKYLFIQPWRWLPSLRNSYAQCRGLGFYPGSS